MLNFIYYPVSFILWCWHWVFGHIFGESSGFAWALAVVFLVFTLRALLFKPFVGQVRSMRKMQEFAPELQKIKKKYANDRQRQAQEMQKLQAEHGVNPLGGCLPMLVQIPVFIGLFHVLRSFKPGWGEVYFFDAKGVESFVNAKLFGANLSTFITMPADQLQQFATSRNAVLFVAIPLMIVASIATHFTARHSVGRQTQAAADNPQTAIMNKLTLYIFPLGVLVGGFFFPIAILLYWLSNNAWTLGQQYVVYHRIDREEEAKKVAATTQRQALAPKPGQKPAPKTAQKKRPAATGQPSAEDAKPAATEDTGASANGKPSTEVPGLSPDRSPGKKQGNKKRR
ncbi:membrane protein insertase YidC [Saccharothrix coeruleofusca]|uniref:Membrane protein insertase YidC n=1 Tax=Saccharothrix coeruleofusca TaxID=33919 RepID=A0A918ECB0_9PSEU|nr:membrane protein insertase YidC [Saccharothrix coeruleofusca]MBP2339955.1 YidC/Oxa1 family membrane protein insertase [Saccharothrix coeruleofusca]GGP38376.1 membrane protein insertase YidC [Saccharothrix coeruleofusca]